MSIYLFHIDFRLANSGAFKAIFPLFISDGVVYAYTRKFELLRYISVRECSRVFYYKTRVDYYVRGFHKYS